MTSAEAKARVVAIAQAELGYQEGADNWNKYAEELDRLNWTWGAKQNQPWCGEFKLWCFYKAFGEKALPVLCSPKPTGIPLCRMGAQYFKDAGRWFTIPELGDVAYFIYDGAINHVGIVVSVSGGVFTTVEGNSSDMVKRNSYAVSSPIVAGFGRPYWDIVADVADAPTPDDGERFLLPTLKKGDTGEVVRAAQFLLNGRGASCGIYGADADFGAATEAAVLAFQRRNSLEADGVIGEQTWSKLLGL